MAVFRDLAFLISYLCGMQLGAVLAGFFQLRDLCDSADVTEFSREGRSQEGSDQLDGHVLADNTASQAEDVGVVVLDRLMGGVVVVRKSGADARQLVGGDRRAGSGSAHHYAALGVAAANRLTHRGGEVGIVDRRGGVSTEIEELVFILQGSEKVFLQRVAGVIGADGDSRSFLLLCETRIVHRAWRMAPIGLCAARGAGSSEPPRMVRWRSSNFARWVWAR